MKKLIISLGEVPPASMLNTAMPATESTTQLSHQLETNESSLPSTSLSDIKAPLPFEGDKEESEDANELEEEEVEELEGAVGGEVATHENDDEDVSYVTVLSMTSILPYYVKINQELHRFHKSLFSICVIQ